MYLESNGRIPTSFQHWLSDRSVPSLSTNAGAPTIAFQEWRKFKEAFAPEIVASAISETETALGRRVNHVVDPFGGSGTTALTCQFLGRASTSIEVNPYLADLIEAKLTQYDFDEVSAAYVKVMAAINPAGPRNLKAAPATFVEPGVGGRYLFGSEAAGELMGILNAIDDCVANPDVSRLFRVLLTSTSVGISNAVVSGKGRRYRRNWQDRVSGSDAVREAFRNLVKIALYDIRRFGGRTNSYRLIRGDARRHVQDVEEFDLAIFSPPYPNSFDYTDVYNIELWVGGYLRRSEDNVALRKQTLRSHVQIARDFSSNQVSSPILSETLSRLDDVREELWNRHIPAMVGAYFDDMHQITLGLAKSMAKDGRMHLIVGDSSYAKVPVPVAAILTEMAVQSGLQVQRTEPFRSMRASPQQGGKAELPETLIVLSN